MGLSFACLPGEATPLPGVQAHAFPLRGDLGVAKGGESIGALSIAQGADAFIDLVPIQGGI